MSHSCLEVESMRPSTFDVGAARSALANHSATAGKVQKSLAIHAALGPIAIETRLKELDREIVAQKAGREPRVALLLGAFGHDGPTPRRRFLFSTAIAGMIAWCSAPRRPETLCPIGAQEPYRTHEIRQERDALTKLKHALS
jgi:hypothetical protein